MERGRSSGRVDDNLESLKKRIQTYNESTLPIIQHFDKINLVKRVDASKDVDQVFAEIDEIFKNI